MRSFTVVFQKVFYLSLVFPSFYTRKSMDNLLNFEELDYQLANIIKHSEMRNNLKIQMEEMDVLRAMYYNDKEFVIDESIVTNVVNYINEIAYTIPSLIEFTINLKLDNFKLEIEVTLPRTYPLEEPQITLRCNQLNRYQQNSLNEDLKNFISSLDRGTICICEAVSWITDNLCNYADTREPENQCTCPNDQQQETIFSRYWIYSHHIYSKEKRKEIISLARTYNLTGFCLSGKPGIICIEGWQEDCENWWQKIRNMLWKKIMCKKKEETKTTNVTCDTLRKFADFVEVNFQNTKNRSHDTHTDMGEFYRYLLKHDCGHVFKDYFGIEGKAPNT